jgi:hypothetical protein
MRRRRTDPPRWLAVPPIDATQTIYAMRPSSPPFETAPRHESPPSDLNLSSAFGEQLATLYALVHRSDYVFGSPLGPFFHRSRHHHVPRFVYFGPHTTEESVRLAFYAGFDRRDLRGTLALLHFVERLALAPDLGQSLNISFFPLVDVLGLLDRRDRNLPLRAWHAPREPELDLLAQDVRRGGYHGFVRVESAPESDAITVRLRGFADERGFLGAGDFIDSEVASPWPIRWETPGLGKVGDGPLSLAADLAFAPFELTVRVPAAWPDQIYRESVATVLRRFILRYRSFLAYGQHL